MMARRAPATATKLRGKVWAFVAYTVAFLPLVPAIMVNVDQAHAGNGGWVWAAAGSIILGAVFFEASLIVSGFWRRAGFTFLALAIVVANVQNAMNSASATSDHRSDHRRNIIAASQKASSQRSQWSQGRAEMVATAGEKPAASIQAEIDSTIAGDATRWRATEECSPLKISAGDSKRFCANIADLKAKHAAALRRDDLDAKIADLDAKGGDETPAVIDPYVENIVLILTLAGAKDSADMRRLISASKDWIRALTLELMAVFGPSAILIIMLSGHRPAHVEQPVERPAKPVKGRIEDRPEPSAPISADNDALASTDPVHAFIASQLEECVGEYMKAGDMWAMAQKWYGDKGMPIGSQRAFGLRLKAAGLAWESNNNRPRYLNVRRKSEAAPTLRVVASNA